MTVSQREQAGMPTLLTVAEAAAVLRMSTKRLYGLICSGIVPAVRLGRRVRVSRERLEEWIRAGGSAART